MQICLVGFSRPDLKTAAFLSESFCQKIGEKLVDEFIILQPTPKVLCGPLREELNRKFPKASVRIEQLEPLSSDVVLNKMKQQPWRLLREILSQIDDSRESIFVLGRGSSLLQHLLWLTAEILSSEAIHIDYPEGVLFRSGTSKINTEISKSSLGAFAAIQANDVNKKVLDREGWYSAEDISEFPGAVASGVNSAMQKANEEGIVIKKESKSGKTIYKLTPKGWPCALQSFATARFIQDETIRDLLIAFARLPSIGPENEFTPPLTSQFMASGPCDGLIVIIQKWDDSFEGNHVTTLDEACETFIDAPFIGDLRGAKEILRQRCSYDSIDSRDHLVVINPSYDENFQLKFSAHLLGVLTDFEEKYGKHFWNFDITNPLNPIKATVSSFANASGAATSYVLKSRGEKGAVVEKVEPSRYPRNSHKLSVPNRFAIEVLNKKPADGYRNILVAMMLYEDLNSNDFSPSQLPFDDLSDDNFHGVTWAELVEFIKNLRSTYDLSKGVLTGSQTRMKELALKRLVSSQIPRVGSSKMRHTLTNEGYLVASQLYSIIKREGMS